MTASTLAYRLTLGRAPFDEGDGASTGVPEGFAAE